MRVNTLLNVILGFMLLGYFLILVGKKFNLRKYIQMIGKACFICNFIISFYIVGKMYIFYNQEYKESNAYIVSVDDTYVIMQSEQSILDCYINKKYICEKEEAG